MSGVKTPVAFLLVLSAFCRIGRAQDFVNLDFESANQSGYSPGGNIPTSVALPGWTAYYSNFGTNAQPQIWYDSLSLGGAFISLTDANNHVGLTPLQGLYSVLLEGSTAGTPAAASIGQIGHIPQSALSLTFYLSLNSSLQVTFGGQPISLVQMSSTPNYDVMGGDISAFAGQTGQLLFTALPGTEVNAGYGLLDNIQFSSSAIPEPSEFALGALGALLLGLRRWRKPFQL
jgi:hypothetical protein